MSSVLVWRRGSIYADRYKEFFADFPYSGVSHLRYNLEGSEQRDVKVEHLSYDVVEEGKQSEILSDVRFTVNDGEMLVITGPNGGGKSTLANC